MSDGITWVENPTDGRLYEVITVPGFPPDDNGEPCECVLTDIQRIELSDTVIGARRPELIAAVLGCPTDCVSWRLVPVTGRTKTGPVLA